MQAQDPLDRILGPLASPPGAEERALDALEQRTAAVDARLDEARARIDAALMHSQRPATRGEAPDLPPADVELVFALRRARIGSRGLLDDAKQAIAEVQARLDRMLDAVRYAARVDTRDADDRLVAASAIGWGGDSFSAMHPALADDDRQRHARRLALILAQRQSRLRFVGVILGGLTRLGAAFGTGGLSALPALYRFVEQVLDALDDRPAVSATSPGALP